MMFSQVHSTVMQINCRTSTPRECRCGLVGMLCVSKQPSCIVKLDKTTKAWECTHSVECVLVHSFVCVPSSHYNYTFSRLNTTYYATTFLLVMMCHGSHFQWHDKVFTCHLFSAAVCNFCTMIKNGPTTMVQLACYLLSAIT